MTQVRAIAFDCFHTVVDLRFDRLPILELDSGAVYSTVPNIMHVFEEIEFRGTSEDVHHAFVDTWHKAEAKRAEEMHEVPGTERMGWLCDILGIRPDEAWIQLLLEEHGNTLLAATSPMMNAEVVLDAISRKVRTGLLSNFDRTRTVELALSQHRLTPFFYRTMVSESEGLVKPNPELFARLAAALEVDPSEILFVGDQPYADVQGALSAGMHAAWLAYRPEQASEVDERAIVLRDLGDLMKILP